MSIRVSYSKYTSQRVISAMKSAFNNTEKSHDKESDGAENEERASQMGSLEGTGHKGLHKRGTEREIAIEIR